MAARSVMDQMSDGERERVRRLIRRLKELLREAGGSDFMTEAQRAELLSITEKLGPIFEKYSTRKR